MNNLVIILSELKDRRRDSRTSDKSHFSNLIDNIANNRFANISDSDKKWIGSLLIYNKNPNNSIDRNLNTCIDMFSDSIKDNWDYYI